MKKRSILITSLFFTIFFLLSIFTITNSFFLYNIIFTLIPSIYCSYFLYKLGKDFYYLHLDNKNIKNFKPRNILLFFLLAFFLTFLYIF